MEKKDLPINEKIKEEEEEINLVENAIKNLYSQMEHIRELMEKKTKKKNH